MSFKDFLVEAPLPDKWDKSKFKPRSFKEMIDYAKLQAPKLGSGSSRVAFEVEYKGRPTVIKVAKNKKGIIQNIEEVNYLDDGFIGTLDCVIPLIDYDEENGDHGITWIHTEKADKAKAADFVKETNVPLGDLVDYCYEISTGKKLPAFINRNITGKIINHDSDLVSSLQDLFAVAEGLLPGDLCRIANWGKYDGRLVVIDLGFNDISSRLYQL